jgi:hypothetical protein
MEAAADPAGSGQGAAVKKLVETFPAARWMEMNFPT